MYSSHQSVVKKPHCHIEPHFPFIIKFYLFITNIFSIKEITANSATILIK